MSTVRFIHSADLHLDSPFKGRNQLPELLREQMREATFEAFDRLIQQAIQHKVDFVLLVGDLFDEETRSLKAQVRLRDGFKRLAQHHIAVFLSYGNHDYTQGMRYPITFPDNVHSFEQETVQALPFYKQGEHVATVYGFSYGNRSVEDRKAGEFIRQGTSPYHIAMLHGSLETNSEHDVYAPFKLDELRQRHMDYWALGHIHKRQQLAEQPPIVYPGNIQGRSRKESGEKGCLLVELNKEEARQTFIPLHSFTFEEITCSAMDVEQPEELEGLLERAKHDARADTPIMLNIVLKGSNGLLQKWEMEGIVREWTELLNDSEVLEGKSWVWIDQVTIVDRPSFDMEELKSGKHFAGEYLGYADALTTEELSRQLSPLYEHRLASKYLELLTDGELKEVLSRAKQLVVEQFLAEEETKQ
ncbi:metallophosphoesterase family protein [Halobacillus naozhouensis]|uniref:DNA repair exonuclease n=1 Tax=Halobacillus naozhouensis TaxID=554880 RepID=A0ABY8J0N8_9BACI|nr:DNA repair exonuclease [Halobacillus naozhouensis]WFT76068.1 DNA repair exonuclease [Halobacillus naozhouensis]